jgi:3-hydroxyisobutyrate dehydrogenase-like beta-hydroxyacid dehydrogenase
MTSDDLRPAIAFLGTGILGSAMVQRLLSQRISVTAWNRTPGKLAGLAEAGARIAPTPGEAAATANLVCLCLTNAAAVERVVFSDDGIVQAARPAGSAPRIVIDFSTIGPDASRDFAQRLAAQSGDHWLDAPVSGGVRGAAAGTLILFCGGEASDLAIARPLLLALSQRATLAGGVGAGQVLKLCNQLIVATTLLAIGESIELARARGVDVTAMPATLAGGFADSTLLQLFGPRMAAGQTEPRTGAIATMMKDVDAVAMMARASSVGVPLLMSVQRIYRGLCTSGHADDDLVALGHLRAPDPAS